MEYVKNRSLKGEAGQAILEHARESADSRCLRHTNRVEGFEGTHEELARRIGNMDYESVRLFIDALAKDIRRQADGDSGRGRPRLAARLYETAAYFESARDSLEAAWTICKPHMQPKENTEGK